MGAHAGSNIAVASSAGVAPAALAPALSLMPLPLTPPPATQALLLAVRVNGVDRDETVRVLRAGSRILLSMSDWSALHL